MINNLSHKSPYDIRNCIICKKDYYASNKKSKRKSTARTSKTIRRNNSVTCSKICSRFYYNNRLKILKFKKERKPISLIPERRNRK